MGGAAVMRAVLILLVVAYAGALVLAPLGALVAGAFAEGPAAAARALAAPEVRAALGRTVWIAAVAVAIHALFGLALAWTLVRHRFGGRRILNALVDFPFAVSPVVAGYALILLFGRRGLLAPLAAAVGVRVAFALPGMILATIFVTLPFMVRELVPAIERLGVDQEEAAATLGARGSRIFRRVTFPALRAAFLCGVGLTFARALGEFGAVLVTGGGVQGGTETATLFVYRALEERQDVAAYSVALLLGAVSMALVLGIEALRPRADGSRAAAP
jgi:sulfate transport system permease protein